MTSQIFHTDDDQLVQEHDPAVPEINPMEPHADPAEPEPDQATPDTDLAVAEAPLAEPEADLADLTDLAEPEADLAEPEAEQTEDDDTTSHPADAAALADHVSAPDSVSDYLSSAPDGDDAAEAPGMADSSPRSSPPVSLVTVVPESVIESHLAVVTASAGGPWKEIQAMFVDDPRASIERAAGLVDDRVEAFIQSARERQRSMQSEWQANDAGTEELRVALQHYRTFWSSLEDLPAQY